MGAQAGAWNFDGKPADEDLLEKLNKAVAQHAPDGGSRYTHGSIGMLYRSSHTTQESYFEHQPHVTSRGIVVTWDGRLDNREELITEFREQLSVSRMTTDASIVAAAFESLGTDCFPKLVGDWAVSIWDPSEQSLTLAKDFMGIRHLYYYLTPKRIVWCTHLAPIVLLSEVTFCLDEEYVAGYLAWYPAEQLTPYREIQAVPAGTFVTIRNRTAISCSHWSFEPGRRIHYNTDAEYEEHFRHVFRQAVRRRLRSDKPILGELSGGIDSTSIVCMADDILAKGEAETPSLDTVSFYDPTEPAGDERQYFNRVEEKRGKRGHHFDRSKYGYYFSFIYHDFVAVPATPGRLIGAEMALFEMMQHQGYRVILSGIGGDEFVGGIPNPEALLADLIVLLQPINLAKQLAAWSLVKKRPWIHLFLQTLGLLLPSSIRAIFLEQAKVAPWVDTQFARRHRLASKLLGPQGWHGFWRPSRRQTAQTLVAMRRQFAFTPPHSLRFEEKRYPYLDKTVVEFVMSIPATQLLRPRQRRSLMRRALLGIVPPEILLRKSKGYTSRAIVVAFQNVWPELEKVFTSPLTVRMGFLNEARLQENLQAARIGNPLKLLPLIRVLYLESWLQDIAERGLIHVREQSLTQVKSILARQES